MKLIIPILIAMLAFPVTLFADTPTPDEAPKITGIKKGEEKMIVEIECHICNKDHSIKMSFAGHTAWIEGELIQDALPELSSGERESGTKSWLRHSGEGRTHNSSVIGGLLMALRRHSPPYCG